MSDPATDGAQLDPLSQPAAIRLDHVFKSFDGNEVLIDVSLEIPHGKAFGLLGRSGMGKSVILSLISADRGAVLIEGKDLQKLRRKDLLEARKRIGFLFQQAALFDSLSVRENVEFPLHRHTKKSRDEIRDIVHRSLESVGLEHDTDKMPAALSGGMRRRAGLARALVLDPPIILADEPSSGLDAITASEIYDLLHKLRERGKTLVVVTHDGSRVREFVDEIAVLDQGRIVASGTAGELAASRNKLVHELIAGKER